jgi:hypothetical protein
MAITLPRFRHEETGNERLVQSGRGETGLKNGAQDQEQDEPHNPEQGLAQILDQ